MQDALVPDVITYDFGDDASKLRREWARSLEQHLALAGLSRKAFRQSLEDAGLDVSVQAIGQWLRGETAPRPHHQAVIAAVLRVPVPSLFPINAKAAS